MKLRSITVHGQWTCQYKDITIHVDITLHMDNGHGKSRIRQFLDMTLHSHDSS